MLFKLPTMPTCSPRTYGPYGPTPAAIALRPLLGPSLLYRVCLPFNYLPAYCVMPLITLPCASLVTPPYRALRLETCVAVCSAQNPPPDDCLNTPPLRLRLNRTTAPFPVRTARTTPPLHPSLRFKTHIRYIHSFFFSSTVPLPAYLPTPSCRDVELTVSSNATDRTTSKRPICVSAAPTLFPYAPRALHSRRCDLRLPFAALCASNPVLPLARHEKRLRTALPYGVHHACAPPRDGGTARVLLERLQLRLRFTFSCVSKRICVAYTLLCTVPACRPCFPGAAAA